MVMFFMKIAPVLIGAVMGKLKNRQQLNMILPKTVKILMFLSRKLITLKVSFDFIFFLFHFFPLFSKIRDKTFKNLG